jgi:tetratricopeptide (TPR) repeat protein
VKKTILFLIAAFFAAQNSYSAGLTNWEEIRTISGPRSTAMAGAYTALADDADAVFLNPAGLQKLSNIEINLAYSAWLLDSSTQYISAALPVGYGAVGAQFYFLSQGTIDGRRDDGFLTNNQITPYSLGGSLAYGAKITDYLSGGLGLKFANKKISSDSYSACLADAGLIWKIADGFYAGAALRNYEPFSGDLLKFLAAGISYKIINALPHELTACLEYNAGSNALSLGAEYSIARTLFVRAGYEYKPENNDLGLLSGLTAGIGVGIAPVFIDYALKSFADLGFVHMVGLRLSFGAAQTYGERERLMYVNLVSGMSDEYFREGQKYFDEGNFEAAAAKWKKVKEYNPDYKGIDAAIDRANQKLTGAIKEKQLEEYYSAAVADYTASNYAAALDKWKQIARSNPGYKDTESLIKHLTKVVANGEQAEAAEKYFQKGMKQFNACDYEAAMKYWDLGLKVDKEHAMMLSYREKAKAELTRINADLEKARGSLSGDEMLEGVKKLRKMIVACPAYVQAVEVLDSVKIVIDNKCKDMYFKGIQDYMAGNTADAIQCWTSIEDLNPNSEYNEKVKRYIEDAKNKQKAAEKLGK